MRILYKTVWLCLLAVCCCTMAALPATAKVCFVGDPDCASGTDFGEYSDPKEEGESLCVDEGYITKTACDAQPTKYVVGYCPYNSDYVMCCGREYAYDKCVYPLVADGEKCGGKYKCKCDSGKYPYKQQNATLCVNTATGAQYMNSIASGASCAYTGYSNNQTTTNIYFTECLCDRGLYPKTEQECTENGSTPAGNSCTDSNGNTYYSACICNEDFYKVISSDCKYGTYITDPLCTQGDVVKAPKCCECNISTFPYEDMNHEEVETYTSCEKEIGCTRGSRYKATSCKLGYKIDGGKCVPKDCDEILVDYMNEKKIKDYSLYETGKTPSTKNVIVAADTGYGAKWENFYNKKVISGAAYAQTITGSDSLTKLVKQQCSEAPRIEISGTNMSSTSPLDFTSVIVDSSSSWWNKGGVTCTNCGIEGFVIYNDSGKSMELKYDSGKPNADNMYVDAYELVIGNKSTFSSTGYDYTLDNLEIKNTAYSKVFFSGKSASSYNTFRVTGKYTQGGAAGFRYYNVYSANTYIGCPNGGTGCGYDKDNTGYDESGISIYFTNWYLWENPTNSYNLYMESRSYLGYPTGQYLDNWGNYSNRIIGRDFMWYYTSVNDVLYNSEDSGRCSGAIGTLNYIDSNGSVRKINFSGEGHRLLCVGNGHNGSCGNRYVVWKGTGSHSESVNGGNCDAKRCVFCAGVL